MNTAAQERYSRAFRPMPTEELVADLVPAHKTPPLEGRNSRAQLNRAPAKPRRLSLARIAVHALLFPIYLLALALRALWRWA
ncbi:hypothetical protein [Variovorax sp. DAIF25]|uniref:hypothetical protein n=1 Tax=Variovorax sp. DAIF25 TaxID=3080983 RepID=UPI003D6BB8E7